MPGMSHSEAAKKIRAKMEAGGCNEQIINSFLANVEKVMSGTTGMISGNEINSDFEIPSLDALSTEDYSVKAPLESLAVIKLNGGLGTGMGLDKAKSLLPVKGGDCFLDFIARQILHLRQQTNSQNPRFLLMNSFSTREDSLKYLEKYPELANSGALDFVQNKVPKIDAESFEPAEYPANPELEWCPPGHGDIYPSLSASGMIEELLNQGIHYLFVSNSDNLGATVDLNLLGYFAQSGKAFLMEVAARTEADKKGGHLAQRNDGHLVLRESAQCPENEVEAFQDFQKFKYFNTNSLWIHLPQLKGKLDKSGGFLPLPLIRNSKPINPTDPESQKTYQIESAMGAAIECFDNAGAILVPRSRFAPVKTTNDLFSLRSDAYVITPDDCIRLADERDGVPPDIKLDPDYYKYLESFDRLTGEAIPSLIQCENLTVSGAVKMSEGVTISGAVTIRTSQSGESPALMRPGLYQNATFDL